MKISYPKDKLGNTMTFPTQIDLVCDEDGTNLKDYINNIVTNNLSAKISFDISHTELPETGESSTIYLIPNNSGDEYNAYTEYIFKNDKWEIIGSANIDLTNYVQKDIKIIGIDLKDDIQPYEFINALINDSTSGKNLSQFISNNTNVKSNTTNNHKHPNKNVLDAIEVAFTNAKNDQLDACVQALTNGNNSYTYRTKFVSALPTEKDEIDPLVIYYVQKDQGLVPRWDNLEIPDYTYSYVYWDKAKSKYYLIMSTSTMGVEDNSKYKEVTYILYEYNVNKSFEWQKILEGTNTAFIDYCPIIAGNFIYASEYIPTYIYSFSYLYGTFYAIANNKIESSSNTVSTDSTRVCSNIYYTYLYNEEINEFDFLGESDYKLLMDYTKTSITSVLKDYVDVEILGGAS